MAKFLLAHGAKPTEGAFELSLNRRQGAMLPLLLQHGFDPNSVHWDTPPLVKAAWFGSPEAIKLLLKTGQQVNAVNAKGKTALHYAANRGDAESVKALIAAGATVSARDHDGNTPLILAAGAFASNLTWKGKERSVRDSHEVLTLLLAHGADVNAHSKEGLTPLAAASLHGDALWVETLLKAGAKIDACGRNGWTPLHYAAAKGHANIVKLLLAAGANPAAQTTTGATPEKLAKDPRVKSLLRG